MLELIADEPLREIHLAQLHIAILEVDPPAECVGDSRRLLVDLLEHEVFVTLLLRGDGVPIDSLGLADGRGSLPIKEVDPVGVQDGGVTVVQEDKVARVLHHRGHVACGKLLAVREPNDER